MKAKDVIDALPKDGWRIDGQGRFTHGDWCCALMKWTGAKSTSEAVEKARRRGLTENQCQRIIAANDGANDGPLRRYMLKRFGLTETP